jgi:DNA-binding NarL/FixJ family response regulator
MTAKSAQESKSHQRRILLVDDHAIVREGLAEIINSKPDLEVCGQASAAGRALEAVSRLRPDLVVVDLSLQGGSGLELIKQIKKLHPHLPMLVLSMHDEALYAERCLRAGALGYVMKQEEAGTVMQAVRSVLRGEVHVSKAVRGRMLRTLAGRQLAPDQTGISHLSDREIEIFQLIGEGRTTRQIAQKLHLSLSTVETHRAHIKEKLDLCNAAELMRAAVEWATRR